MQKVTRQHSANAQQVSDQRRPVRTSDEPAHTHPAQRVQTARGHSRSALISRQRTLGNAVVQRQLQESDNRPIATLRTLTLEELMRDYSAGDGPRTTLKTAIREKLDSKRDQGEVEQLTYFDRLARELGGDNAWLRRAIGYRLRQMGRPHARDREEYARILTASLKRAGVLPDFPRLYGLLRQSAYDHAYLSWEGWQDVREGNNFNQRMFENALGEMREHFMEEFLGVILGKAVGPVSDVIEIAEGIEMVLDEASWNARDPEARRQYRIQQIYSWLCRQLARNLARGDMRVETRINSLLVIQSSRYEDWMMRDEPNLRQFSPEPMGATIRQG